MPFRGATRGGFLFMLNRINRNPQQYRNERINNWQKNYCWGLRFMRFMHKRKPPRVAPRRASVAAASLWKRE